jgi:hypothetical protein
MKIVLKMMALTMTCVVISPLFAGVPQGSSTPPGQQAEQRPLAEPETPALEYKNTKYGFSFSLPASWRGYTILTDKWEGSDVKNGIDEHGPMISIRHPGWTKENPRQDIPIMIFTLAQWDALDHGEFAASAAPVGPTELGRNRKYVFAIPARYNHAEAEGWEEVDGILSHGPLHPLWSK